MTSNKESHTTQEEASLKVHRSRSVRRAEGTTDGKSLVSQTGTALLSELAECTGVTRGMSEAMGDCGISWNTRDPGVVLTHLAVSIADGADCITDFQSAKGVTRAVRRGRLGEHGLEGGEGDRLH
jgi:hypothetical protein